MPSKKPTQERIEQVKTQFQVVESKVLESGKEKYFQLPYDAALEAIDADLSKTAYRLWIYLSANYPFGDCEVELPSQTELGIRLGVTRQAINIAAAELQAAGLWDFWSERWKGRNLRGFGAAREEGVKKTRQVSKKDDTLSKKSDTRCQKEMTGYQKKMTPCQKNLTPTNLEPLPEAGYTAPQTIHTYTDFKQTLSKEEEENFFNFCKELIANFSQPINDTEAWLASKTKAGQNRWEVYYQKFLAREEEQAKKMTRKTGRQLLEEFYAELEQKQQQATEILNREQEQATAKQRGVTHV